MMSGYSEEYKAREWLINEMKKEMLGPGSEPFTVDIEKEVISTSPEKRYYVGILYPQNNKSGVEDDDLEGKNFSDKEELDEEIAADDKVLNEDHKLDLSDGKGYSSSSSDTAEDTMDESINMSTRLLPSSMGLTFISNRKVDKLKAHIDFAVYKHTLKDDCRIKIPDAYQGFYVPVQFSNYFEYDNNTRIFKLIDGITSKDIKRIYEQDQVDDSEGIFKEFAYRLLAMFNYGFVRDPYSSGVVLDFSKGDYCRPFYVIEDKSVKVCGLRYHLYDDYYSYTVMIINSKEGKARGINSVFQPMVKISSEDNSNMPFCNIDEINITLNEDEEEMSNALLYRNKKNYGTGLGTALNWSIDAEGVGAIWTDFFPMVSVPQQEYKIDTKFNVTDQVFSMKYLSDLNDIDKTDKIAALKSLCCAYDKWINEIEDRLDQISERYHKTGIRHIQNCKQCSARIAGGIKILENDEKAWDAFQLANRAMFMQRTQLSIQREFEVKYTNVFPHNDELGDRIENIDYRSEKDDSFWRPFQLAFLLMSISSIENDSLTNEERNTVDLIWFPTGGGKTEAYLGLTAFTIFYRRLAHRDVSGGTTVIMRYTLRLLASQQFTRASTLICACEYIRQDGQKRKSLYKNYDLGDDPITIGLWIGGAHTPNKVKGRGDNYAETCYNNLSDATVKNVDSMKERYNKFQVLKCPWCGTKLTKEAVDKKLVGNWGYRVIRGKCTIHCTQEGCDFESQLPIQVVDEELYKNPPTLLFATVDKFAMLPWYKETGSFFAVDSENRAPELIIQDELHLISGPLGSMVGIYETAIDYLCSQKGVKPKIIASTATISRAKEQCSELYNREVFQFPPQGIDQEDSFFAKEAADKYGRTYIGVMPSGKTKAMTESMMLATLLQRGQEYEADDSVKDSYWTVTGYFNSLRELGKCSSIVQSDVRDNIRRLAYRNMFRYGRRNILKADELTSHVTTTELNRTLDKLEKVRYSSDKDNRTNPSNILLATNMISVGIDIDRLNVMLVMGQPKLTSEYIQASSRVGRKYPGVVFTQYDSARSRDRSHYEQFKPYHESFYKYVEPTGLTPFSEPARQRALHAAVISMLRHGFDLEEDEDISRFNRDDMKDVLKKISGYIVERVNDINERHTYKLEGEGDNVDKNLQDIYERIEVIVKGSSGNAVYGNIMGTKPEEGKSRIMKPFGVDEDEPLTFDTMTSMRNVDGMVNASIVIMEQDQ